MNLSYCPDCADVFGSCDRGPKRCRCSRSAGISIWRGGDFSTPCEICWYCQAEIIPSGSRWSTYFCGWCRPRVMEFNDGLDALGLVSLPVGRHSLQHARWLGARPFTATPVVDGWRKERLREGWGAFRSDELGWPPFGEFMRSRRGDLLLQAIALRVQEAPPDQLMEVVTAINSVLH